MATILEKDMQSHAHARTGSTRPSYVPPSLPLNLTCSILLLLLLIIYCLQINMEYSQCVVTVNCTKLPKNTAQTAVYCDRMGQVTLRSNHRGNLIR